MKASIGAVTAVMIAAGITPAAQAAAKPDLAIKKVSEPAATAVAGAKLATSAVVANTRRGRARGFRVGFWLSRDRTRSGDDVLLGRPAQKALRGRRTARARRSFTIPPSVTPGAYHLVVCADPARRVKERSERNNCRASRRRIVVSAATLAPGAPAPLPVLPPAPAGGDAAPAPTGGGGGGDGGTTETMRFPREGEPPLSVTHDLDTSRAVTQRIETFGGEITATAANGTTYKLEIPQNALASGENITLTPVVAVDGSPLSGGLIGAVEIRPHGLELLRAATLTIQPAGSAGPVSGQTGFLSHAAGEDFHLYPLALGSELRLHLTHFSTPGVAQATDADRQVVLAHPPARHRSQYEQMMEELIRETRVAQEADPEAGLPADAMAAILRGYWNDIINPVVDQAYSNDALAARATSEVLSWVRQVELLGLQGHRLTKVWYDAWPGVLQAIWENAIHKGYTQCVENHDLDYIVRLVGIARATTLLGIEIGDDAFDKAVRCANFEVDFDSIVTESFHFNTPDGRTGDTEASWHVAADDVPIDITGLGTGSLYWKPSTYSQVMTYPCGSDGGVLRYETTMTATRPEPEFTVLLQMDLNAREPGTPPPADRNIRLRMIQYDNDIGETYRTVATSWCTEAQPEPVTVDEERWRQHYQSLHSGDFTDGIVGWTPAPAGGALIATRNYDHDTGEETATTRFKLFHTPLK